MYEYKGEPLWYHKIILELFFYMVELLEKNKITFWIDCGTLLGAVRNGKIIPWDNDCDLGIYVEDAERLAKLQLKIQKDGYELTVDRNSKYARILRIHQPGNFDFHVDVFTWKTKGDIMPWCCNNPLVSFAYHNTADIQNLGLIKFEGKMLPCPNPPENTLIRFFGEDWRIPRLKTMREIDLYASDNIDIQKEIERISK